MSRQSTVRTATTASSYLLNRPEDWDQFERAYIVKVVAERVLHLAKLEDPSQFNQLRLPEPIEPEYSEYLAKERQEDELGNSTFVYSDRAAERLSDLLPEDKEAFLVDQKRYKERSRKYEKQADGISNVITWLLQSINPDYLVYLTDPGNISAIYNSLKVACGIDDESRRKRARQTYYDVLRRGANLAQEGVSSKPASSRVTMWEDWIIDWEKAVTDGKRKGAAEASDSASWYEDLEKHLDVMFKLLLRITRARHTKEINSNTYLPAHFAKVFRYEIQGDGTNLVVERESSP